MNGWFFLLWRNPLASDMIALPSRQPCPRRGCMMILHCQLPKNSPFQCTGTTASSQWGRPDGGAKPRERQVSGFLQSSFFRKILLREKSSGKLLALLGASTPPLVHLPIAMTVRFRASGPNYPVFSVPQKKEPGGSFSVKYVFSRKKPSTSNHVKRSFKGH
jgi:hypothetical protein